jgi:hypothetical protein
MTHAKAPDRQERGRVRQFAVRYLRAVRPYHEWRPFMDDDRVLPGLCVFTLFCELAEPLPDALRGGCAAGWMSSNSTARQSRSAGGGCSGAGWCTDADGLK